MRTKTWKNLLIAGTIVALTLIVSCSPPIALPKYGTRLNIVEAGPVRDPLLEDLSNWCNNQRTDTVLLWYPNTTLFGNRGMNVNANDTLVFLNNEIVGSYADSSALQSTKTQIGQSVKPITNLGGNLKLRLEPKDLFGTAWDLVIGVGAQEKIVTTPNEGYVLVQFINENGVYRVTSVELKNDWNDLTVPKNIPSSQLRGFAFFKIENGEIVAALVIEP